MARERFVDTREGFSGKLQRSLPVSVPVVCAVPLSAHRTFHLGVQQLRQLQRFKRISRVKAPLPLRYAAGGSGCARTRAHLADYAGTRKNEPRRIVENTAPHCA